MESIWSGVARFAAKAGALTAIAAAITATACLATGQTATADLASGCVIAALVLGGVGVLPQLGGWNARGSFEYQYVRADRGPRGYQRDLAESTSNAGFTALCFAAAVPLFLAGVILFEVGA